MTVAEFIRRAREAGHDALGIANDPEALAILARMRRMPKPRSSLKIVFEFNHKPLVSLGSKLHFTSTGTAPPSWQGGRITGIITDAADEHEGDVLHIEGSLEAIRELFQDGLRQIETLERLMRHQFDRRIARCKQCPVCQRWEEPGDHGDGRGDMCLGDGTVLMGNRRIKLRDTDSTSPDYGSFVNYSYVATLAKGEEFVVAESFSSNVPPTHVYTALEDAKDGHVRVQRAP